jgi:hypothetical protein
MLDIFGTLSIILAIVSLGFLAYPRLKLQLKYQSALRMTKSDLGRSAIASLSLQQFSPDEAEKMVLGLCLGQKSDTAKKMLVAIADGDNDALFEIMRQSIESNTHIFRSYDVKNS